MISPRTEMKKLQNSCALLAARSFATVAHTACTSSRGDDSLVARKCFALLTSLSLALVSSAPLTAQNTAASGAIGHYRHIW